MLEPSQRKILARIGITLLSAFQPGLGLLRLSRLRAAILFAAFNVGCFILIWAIYSVTRTMTYALYVSILAVFSLLAVSNYALSLVHTWRQSRFIEPAAPWWSRWYCVVLAWLAMVALTWPMSDVLRADYRPFYAPSDSMAPGLRLNDHFLGDMRSGAAPKRGDIAIVRTGGVEYVKRVVGLPGDRISIRNGSPVLNGKAATRVRYGWTTLMSRDGPAKRRATFTEYLSDGGVSYRVTGVGASELDNLPEVQLGPNQYYLLGDNRDQSADSRLRRDSGGLGLVDRSEFVGKALFVFRRGIFEWRERALQ